MYAHFTSRQDAEAIVASGVLWACSYLSGHRTKAGVEPIHERSCDCSQCWSAGCVYAVEIGVSHSVPSVQRTKLGRTPIRDWAVVFTATATPEPSPFGEDVIFYTPDNSALRLTDVFIVPADEVTAALADPPPDAD